MRLRAPGLHPQRVDGLPRVHYYAVFKKNVVNPTVAKVIETAQAVCDFDTQEDKRCHWVATMSAATPRTPTPRNSDVAPGYTSLD